MPKSDRQPDFYSHLSDRLKAFHADIQAAFAKVDLLAVTDRLRRLPDEARRIGDAGWTLPMWATPAEVTDILQRAVNDDIDSIFIEYYETHSGANYAQLKRHLARDTLAPWRDLVEQCFVAYEAGLYLVVVPAMITVVEGLIAQAGGPDAWKRKDPKPTVTKILAQSAKDSLQRAVWISIDRFVQRLFEPQSFSTSKPRSMNRHWILHGRDASQWGKPDCLRLFQAADTIAR